MFTDSFRCDSYNTAQIQILSGSASETLVPEAVVESFSNETMDVLQSEIVQINPRGRSTSIDGIARRIATSTSAIQRARSPPADSLPRQTVRSLSEVVVSRTLLSNDTASETDDDSMDMDEDTVHFWGGESPRDRLRTQKTEEDVEYVYLSGDEEEDDDDDEMMDDEPDEDEDDGMELFGHR